MGKSEKVYLVDVGLETTTQKIHGLSTTPFDKELVGRVLDTTRGIPQHHADLADT